eukprot:CAMPEP_0206471602 /NCGR_PEP_ID=MMETSP0324_2-20121206/31666_1 /ASSEMBLY_ACC=CAM_ASM_000836 /TAXON_ID=2866 /ORGANISM="Crypthecodinium cohnii, Strain Seligo" /LENGTH=194 /DNA_ID=CAMNT_0053945969 /DNA_START=114 /DNA_END=695 /DNA_ORIENTATION=-
MGVDSEDESGDENVIYASKKGLAELKEKLAAGKEITAEELKKFSSPRVLDPEEIVVPIDLRGLDSLLDDDDDEEADDFVNEDMALDVDRLIEKVGVEGAASALIKAQEALKKGKQADGDVVEEMKAKEWVEMIEEGIGEGEESLDMEQFDEDAIPDDEEGEEEEVDLSGEFTLEDHLDDPAPGEPDPPAKKRKL